jgi:hypothetical protein
MHLIGKARPEPQILYGSGFKIPLERVEAPDFPLRYVLKRRVLRRTVGGIVVSKRVEIVEYHVTISGEVFRVNEDGRRVRIEPRDRDYRPEWDWVRQCLAYRFARRFGPVAPGNTVPEPLRRPEDLVSISEGCNDPEEAGPA